MNKQQHSIGELATQCLPGRHSYTAPWCAITPYKSESFICATIEHEASLSTEEDWEEEEVEGDYPDYSARFDWQP